MTNGRVQTWFSNSWVSATVDASSLERKNRQWKSQNYLNIKNKVLFNYTNKAAKKKERMSFLPSDPSNSAICQKSKRWRRNPLNYTKIFFWFFVGYIYSYYFVFLRLSYCHHVTRSRKSTRCVQPVHSSLLFSGWVREFQIAVVVVFSFRSFYPENNNV